jgi:hypothetical protein
VTLNLNALDCAFKEAQITGKSIQYNYTWTRDSGFLQRYRRNILLYLNTTPFRTKYRNPDKRSRRIWEVGFVLQSFLCKHCNTVWVWEEDNVNSRDGRGYSSFGTHTWKTRAGWRLECARNLDLIPDRDRQSPLVNNVQTGSGTHAASITADASTTV